MRKKTCSYRMCFHSNESISRIFKAFYLLPFFLFSLSGCDKAEKNHIESPSVEYKQLVVGTDSSVDNLFAIRTLESGYSIDYHTRGGMINLLDYALEHPDASGYVSIEKAYTFGDRYILIVHTGENGLSCPATTYAIGIDSKSESVTGKEKIDGCAEVIETFSEGNKLVVKKEGAASTFINGEVKLPPLNPSAATSQPVEKNNQIDSKITIKLLSNVDWLAEGSGVLLTTDKGYISGYTQSMMSVLEDSKKGECYSIWSESGKAITIHNTKHPDLDSLKNETEDLVAERVACN